MMIVMNLMMITMIRTTTTTTMIMIALTTTKMTMIMTTTMVMMTTTNYEVAQFLDNMRTSINNWILIIETIYLLAIWKFNKIFHAYFFYQKK